MQDPYAGLCPQSTCGQFALRHEKLSRFLVAVSLTKGNSTRVALRAALVAGPFRGTLSPVDLRAVCLIQAIVLGSQTAICWMCVSEQALKYLHRRLMSRVIEKCVKVTSPWRHHTCYTLHCLALLFISRHHAPPHTLFKFITQRNGKLKSKRFHRSLCAEKFKF